MFLKTTRILLRKKRCFSKTEKPFIFDRSCCKDVQESGTTSLQSSLTFTAGRQLNVDRSLLFSLVGHLCSDPKLRDCWETCQLECFLPEPSDLAANLCLVRALFLIPNYWERLWLGREAHSKNEKRLHLPHPLGIYHKNNLTQNQQSWYPVFSVTADIPMRQGSPHSTVTLPSHHHCVLPGTFLPCLKRSPLTPTLAHLILALNNNIGAKLFMHAYLCHIHTNHLKPKDS